MKINKTDFFRVNGYKVANIKNYSENSFFGIGVLAGGKHETPELAGISHFIEHMIFKGTKTKTWKDLNEEMAKLGVSNNATTDRDMVFYYATFPQYNLKKISKLLLDMFFNSTFDTEEIEKERNVIIEEKKARIDSPDAFFYDTISEKFFTWNNGHNLIGDFNTINSINQEKIKKYCEDKYNKNSTILVFSGNISTNLLKSYLKRIIPLKKENVKNEGKTENNVWNEDIVKNTDKIKLVMEKDNIAQSQVAMLMDGIEVTSKDYEAYVVLANALGGGSYSKLYTRLREELGLCYVVGAYSVVVNYPKNTCLFVSGNTDPKNVGVFIEETEKILKDVKENGIDKNMFECAKTDLIAEILRFTETSRGKAMYALNRYAIGNEEDIGEMINRAKKVTLRDCNRVAKKVLNGLVNWAVMNPKAK